MPGIPVGDHYPEIHRVNELPQVTMLPVSRIQIFFSYIPPDFAPSERLRQTLPSDTAHPSLWYISILLFCYGYTVN